MVSRIQSGFLNSRFISVIFGVEKFSMATTYGIVNFDVTGDDPHCIAGLSMVGLSSNTMLKTVETPLS